MLKSGDLAPHFTLTDQHGSAVSPSSLRGRKALECFYP
jgi:peroxiredoxin